MAKFLNAQIGATGKGKRESNLRNNNKRMPIFPTDEVA